MTTVELTSTEACGYVGRDGITDAQIELAAQYIASETGSTVVEHVDDRGIALVSVKAAWAVVAARMSEGLEAYTLDVLASESQGDYSYSASTYAQLPIRDLLAGLPRQLLRLTAATWSTAYGSARPAAHPFWKDLDQQAPGFVP